MQKEFTYNYNYDTEVFTYRNKYGTARISMHIDDLHVSLSKFNIKVGNEIMLNTLPGEDPIAIGGKPLTNVKGTCSGICKDCSKCCYAIKGSQLHHNTVMPSIIKNTLLSRHRPERFWMEVDEQLTSIEAKAKTELVFRFHSSGEVINYEYLVSMMKLAEAHPSIKFYSYTKRFNLILRYLREYNDFPSNFTWNLSYWNHNIDEVGFTDEDLKKVQIFAYDDGLEPSMSTLPHCPSVIKLDGQSKGHLSHKITCRECGLCWKGKMKGKTIAVYNH